MTLPQRLLVTLLVYSLLLTNLPFAAAKPSVVSSHHDTQEQNPEDDEGGLKFCLSEVSAPPSKPPSENVVAALPLSQVETNNVLSRLPQIVEDAAEQPFRLRERSLPPPKVGKTIRISFPGDGNPTPPNLSGGPLTILRYSPEGADGRTAVRWQPVWFEHQNFRDERTEAFASLLWDGVHSYTYVVRATTPGLFIVPPAKAEEMYHPETFGRGRTDRVKIE